MTDYINSPDKPPIDFTQLIPELKDWDNGKEAKVEAWIECFGNYEHIVAYASLLWPQFVEFDGAVLLASRFHETAYRDWMNKLKGNKQQVEAMLNHTHVVDLFSYELDPTDEQLIHIGRLFREMWECKLKRDFPTRNFEVWFDESKDDGTILDNQEDYQFTFCQIVIP